MPLILRKLKVRLRALLKWLLLVLPVRELGRIVFMRFFWRLRYLTTTLTKNIPTVGLVTPVYNNRKLVQDAIRSARAQTWANIQHFIVDDGSTDGSAEVLDRFAADAASGIRAHKPMRAVGTTVIHQANAGPGAARNRGVAEALKLGPYGEQCKYLLFLDSDDLLPIDGVKRLVERAEQTGSPLVIGRLERIDGVRRFQRRDNMHVYAVDRNEITIDDAPEVLSDANISAKLFRVDFWRDNKLEFPEGVVFEDMPVVVGAYLNAPKFDIVSAPVNLWRVRPEGASITQRRTQLKSLADRMTAIERNIKMIQDAIGAKRCTKRVLESYLARVISLDLQLYVISIAASQQDFFEEFRVRAAGIVAGASESVWQSATGAHKDLVRLAISGSRSQVVQAITAKGL